MNSTADGPVAEMTTTAKMPPPTQLSLQLRLMRAAFWPLCRLAPGLAARWALDLFQTPRRVPRPAREVDALTGGERRELRVEGERIVSWSWGEGPLVLLVHGWEGRGSQLAMMARALAEAGFRAVIFDAPGHGDSSGRRSSVRTFAAVIEAVAQEVGPLWAVIAHSFGAVATAVAGRSSLEAERLVFVSAPADVDPFMEQAGELLGLPREVRDRMLEAIERRHGLPWAEARRVMLDTGVAVPLLVFHDMDDGVTPFADGEAIARSWPMARLHRTRGLGHRRILRDPATIQQVVAFVEAGAVSEGSGLGSAATDG